MSEKQQHTATSMREHMLHRYGDTLHHKHNKNHISYRRHYKSHPIELLDSTDIIEKKGSTGLLRARGLRKLRKRLDKNGVH